MSGRRQASDLLETQTRRAFVLKARKAGLPYWQIAARAVEKFGANALPQGWDERYAYKDVARELAKLQNLNNGLSEDVRQLEIERLDRLIVSLWPQATKPRPDYQAVDRVLRVMERRAKLLGLDAPTVQQISGPEGGPVVVVNWDGVEDSG